MKPIISVLGFPKCVKVGWLFFYADKNDKRCTEPNKGYEGGFCHKMGELAAKFGFGTREAFAKDILMIIERMLMQRN